MVALIVYTPFIGTALMGWYGLHHGITWLQIAEVILMWQLGCISITIGLHRWLTHRGFEERGFPGKMLKFLLLVGANMSAEGPPIFWVAAHVKHHKLSDKEGDPHSPTKGFWYAHFGWMFKVDPSTVQTFGRYLLKDKLVVRMNDQYFFWLGLRFVMAYLLLGGYVGLLLSLTALFLTHHTTWSVNSVCHVSGSRRFETEDFSTNNFLIACLAAGEGNHNNHHGIPKSARHGLTWKEPDLSWLLIVLFHKVGLITEPYVPTREAIDERISHFKAIKERKQEADKSLELATA